MAERKLRWGLLSTARINTALIEPIRASKRSELAAIASRSEARAKEYAREWGIPRWHGTYEALIEDPEIDVIYNPLPNSMHAEWSIRAMQAGKHVLCEKPLALSVAEVDQMQAAAKANGVILTEAFMYRHHPQTRKVKELADSGAIGQVYLVRGSFTFLLTREGDVRLASELGGGGIWDVGCYPISYSRMIMGAEPETVYGWQMVDYDVDVAFAGQMEFPGGRVAQFDSGLRSPFRVGIEIVGTNGSIWVPAPFAPKESSQITLRQEDKTEEIKIPGMMLYLGEVQDIEAAVMDGKTPLISLEDSRGTVRTIVACLESARTGKPVQV